MPGTEPITPEGTQAAPPGSPTGMVPAPLDQPAGLQPVRTHRAGGPQTPEGKARSAQNAAKHYARADPKRLLALFDRGKVKRLRDTLGQALDVEEEALEVVVRAMLAERVAGRALELGVRQLAATYDEAVAASGPAVANASVDLAKLDAPFRYGTAATKNLQRALSIAGLAKRQRGHDEERTAPGRRAAVDALREVFMDGNRRAEFLARAFNTRQAGPAANGSDAAGAGTVAAEVFRDPRAGPFATCYLSRTRLPHGLALLAAGEWMADPKATLADLSRRSGIRRTKTAKRLLRSIRSAEEAGGDWALAAIRRSLMPQQT